MIKLKCPFCGSENLVQDLTATWDVPTQQWITGQFSGSVDCLDCDEMEIEPIEEPVHWVKPKAEYQL